MKTITAVFFFSIIAISCKKGYTCACSSDDGFYDGFDIKGSKKNAERECDSYYKSKYQYVTQTDSIPMSPVKCELKKGE